MLSDTERSPLIECARCGRVVPVGEVTGVVIGGHDHGRLCLLCLDAVLRSLGREVRDELRRQRRSVRPSPRRVRRMTNGR